MAKLNQANQEAAGLTALPTQDAPLTQQGAILGTFQYMAPEQLEGQEADARTDIFAFGTVVYEMVTGTRASEGKSQASLIAAIMGVDPPLMSTLQTMTPPALDYVVKTCLAKDPDDRWQSVGDVKRQLRWITAAGPMSSKPGGASAAARPRIWRPPVSVSVASVLVGAVFAGVSGWNLKPSPARASAQFVLRAGADAATPVVISPDGAHVVYPLGNGPDVQLFVRPIDQLDATPLRGTEGAWESAFSPDGAWVAFLDGVDGALRRVPLAGGPPETICDCDLWPTLRGHSWGPDGEIVFGREGTEGLWRVAAVGGEPELFTTVDPARELDHRWPAALPNGQAVLFTAWSGAVETSRIALVSLETGAVIDLLDEGSGARYAPSGHIVYYAGGGTLRAVGFDEDRLEITSDSPVHVLEGVAEFIGALATSTCRTPGRWCMP